MKNIISLQKINKEFDSIKVLKDISFSVGMNEVLGLVGENGAGKSTLMKILLGIYQPDEGRILLSEQVEIIHGPTDAVKKGIGMVFQEGSLISGLSIVENIFLGYENFFSKIGIINKKKRDADASEILEIVGLSRYYPNILVDLLSASERQMVEIGRLLWVSRLYKQKNPILIFDEPTTVLTKKERDVLFNLINELKANCSFIFISHRLEEIMELSDKIVVLRDGELIAETRKIDTTLDVIENFIVGKSRGRGEKSNVIQNKKTNDELTQMTNKNVLLKTNKLYLNNKFSNISFDLFAGEVLSFVGLIGSGKEELIETFFGLHKIDSGKIEFLGKELIINQPKDAVKNGIGLIPIDRRMEGLATELTVKDNISLLYLKNFIKFNFLNKTLEEEFVQKQIKKFNIKTRGTKTTCKYLSGGNQQKIVLAKWFSTDANVFILNHPTRGIDVGAKREIYSFIRKMTKNGYSFIVLCDSLDEDIELADRIILMKEKQIIETIDVNSNNITPADLLYKII